MDTELNKDMLEWLSSIKEGIEKIEDGIKRKSEKKEVEMETETETESFDYNSFRETIIKLIEDSDMDEMLGFKDGESREWNGKEWKPIEEFEEFKIISDKFLVGIKTESNDDIIDEDREGTFHLEYLPCGEKIELFYNKKRTEKKSEDFLVFNTDENSLYEHEFLRTLFRKSEHWKVYPFIEYNSDGTVSRQNMVLDNFRFKKVNGDDTETIIDIKDIKFE